MSELENRVADLLRDRGFYVLTRQNHCDVLAIKHQVPFLIECKNYDLTSKQQAKAIRQLNRNYTYALETLLQLRLPVRLPVIKILVAKSFDHWSRNISLYTYEELEDFMKGVK